MIDKEIIKRLATENKVSENIVEMIIKDAILCTIAKFNGTDKNYLIDLNSLEVTILHNGIISKTQLKNIGGRQFALALRSKVIELMKELNPSKSKNKQTDNSKDLLNKTLNERTEIDPYENFRWGGLSGEEAHTGYWNTD